MNRLSFKAKPENALVVVSDGNTLAGRPANTDLVKIRQDLDLAIVTLESKMRRPEFSMKNLGTLITGGAAVADELTTAIMNPEDVVKSAQDPLNIVKSVGVGFGLIFSGVYQLNKYWQRQNKASTMTETLLKGIDPEIVRECFYEQEDTQSKEKIKTILDGVYDSNKAIAAMSEHGSVSILLRDAETVITLKNITLYNRKTAIALVAGLIGPAIYTGSQVLDFMQPEQSKETSTFAHASVMLATGVPFVDVWNTIEGICYGQERNILDATRLIIINCYADNIYMVPEKLLMVLENFVKTEIVTELREAKDEILTGRSEDLEAQVQTGATRRRSLKS